MIKIVQLKTDGYGETGEYAVYKGNRLLRVFDDKEDAQNFCVGLHTDLLWEQSNKD